MQQFNVKELIHEIVKNCCILKLEPIHISFVDIMHVVLMIGQNSEAPEIEIEIGFDGKSIRVTIFQWSTNNLELGGEYENQEFNIFVEDDLRKLTDLLLEYCTNQNVLLQYQAK